MVRKNLTCCYVLAQVSAMAGCYGWLFFDAQEEGAAATELILLGSERPSERLSLDKETQL